jgi:transketolase
MMHDFVLREMRPGRFGFGEGLCDLGQTHANVVALGADISSSVSMHFFRELFPDRFFSFGIAEQNIMAVAAGLAMEGKIPFMATYGVFAALRAADQLRISVCYNNVPVKIGGAHAGISVGPDGATHQALEDIALIRALPNISIFSPCDATQCRLATIAAVEQISGPVYIRFGRETMPDFTEKGMEFVTGKAQIFKEGRDLSIIATGHLTWEALKAAKTLNKKGISARVINIHTLKPLDENMVIKAAKETGAIVSAEEHQITGGLGSAIAETLARACPAPQEFVGMPDCFGESGQPYELMEKYGMTDKAIVIAAEKVLQRK